MTEQIKYLHCHSCGKQVSTGFIPVPIESSEFKNPIDGIIVRAWIECPECIEKNTKETK